MAVRTRREESGTDVLVVGASPGGLAAASALGALGIGVIVIDEHAVPLHPVDDLRLLPSVELWLGWRAVALSDDRRGVSIDVEPIRGEAPEGTGPIGMRAQYAIACEASRSLVRTAAIRGESSRHTLIATPGQAATLAAELHSVLAGTADSHVLDDYEVRPPAGRHLRAI